MAPFPRKRNEAVLIPLQQGTFSCSTWKPFQPGSLVPRELTHNPAKPQHGPTVSIGYKFKAVCLFKNLCASIARFSFTVPGAATQRAGCTSGPAAREPQNREEVRGASDACEVMVWTLPTQTKNRGALLVKNRRINFLGNVGNQGDLFCYSMVLTKSLLYSLIPSPAFKDFCLNPNSVFQTEYL